MARKPTYEELELRVEELEKKTKKLKQTEESLKKKTNALNERVKELNCLYSIAKIRERKDIAFEAMLQEIVDLIPPSWQYQEISCARIIIEGQEYKTKNFKETIRKQTSNIVVNGKRIGILEICYLEEKPKSNEGPFLKEERSLINAIAEQLGLVTERVRAEKTLRKSEERFRNLTEVTSDWIWEVDQNGFYAYVSPKIYDMLGYDPEEIIGKTPFDLMPPDEADRVSKFFKKISSSRESFDCLENINLHKDGHPVVFETSGTPTFDDNGEFLGYRGIDRNITKRKQAEEELKKAHDELEYRVKKRTEALEDKTRALEELNTAMKVLLQKRQEDKTDIEDNVLTNIKELIAPYFDKIKRTKLSNQQEAFLSIIESNLNEIISPFARKMSLKYLDLTPTEIQIANLIIHGNTTKKIAKIMSVSPRTIDTHRYSIRKKIGLQGQKGNLRSHLLSLN